MTNEGRIIRVSGPLVVAEGLPSANMYDVVYVSESHLIGEVIELRGEEVYIQVYEDTEGLGVGEPVVTTGAPLSVQLGPGLIGSIYDGIQRPLDLIKEKVGDFITRGISIPGLDTTRQWKFSPLVKKGAYVTTGDVLGTVTETKVVSHRVMVPPDVDGTVKKIAEGAFTLKDIVCSVETPSGRKELTMLQSWPVRKERPYAKKLPPNTPLITGTRIIDAFFPIAKGGTACIPGPFGSGKTVCLHTFAKWADADIIVYVGCGERGNEMTDVLLEFPELDDPRGGGKLIDRTVLIANTSNMPVAAREASIYTGITIAEYYRDMGYNVSVMADSTSRWAEALREMSGRLEEMPGEEGYPAYLPTRLANFYERAGRVICKGSVAHEGSLSVLGAVSPPGGDLGDPVVQATLKIVQVFWALDDQLAFKRHFPAINWLTSYSLYLDNLSNYMSEKIDTNWIGMRERAIKLLQQEAELEEIARLIGMDMLSGEDKLVLLTSKSIREDFLHQNAFHEIDAYTSLAKQHKMLEAILKLHNHCKDILKAGLPADKTEAARKDISFASVREKIARAKYISEENLSEFDGMNNA